ncbi:hypothetical protein Gotur_003680 [Gossypium turneri]
MRETLEVVEGRTDELDSMKEQLKDFMFEPLDSNVEKMQWVLNSTVGELAERNDALEAMVIALKEETITTMRALNTRIKELDGELVVCRAVVGKEVLGATLNHEIVVPKWEKFKGTMSTRKVNNFLWEMEQYFHAMGIKDDDVKARSKLRWFLQQGTTQEHVKEFSKLMLQITKLTESLIEFTPRKDKFKSSNPNGKGNGGEDEEGQVKHDNENGGNGKLRNEKWKTNNKLKEKESEIKCFLCDSPHMVRNCPKRL